VDKTVLAAEQVDHEGRAWRSGALVEKRTLPHWAIETPKYAKRLLNGLDSLRTDWNEVADIQKEWIGKCDVHRFLLPVKSNSAETAEKADVLDLRINDPSSLAHAKFVVVQNGHALAEKSQETQLTAFRVHNFANGLDMPVICLAKNFEDPSGAEYNLRARLGLPQSNSFDGELMRTFDLKSAGNEKNRTANASDICQAAERNNYGGYETSRTLQDWIVSRQRGWGTPIPMIIPEDGNGAAVPVSEQQLPITNGMRGQKVQCEQLPSGTGVMETDTLDTFVDSSWYFLRYLDPHNTSALVDRNLAEQFMPVDVYVGGIEHADKHLFYARFISYFLHDIGAVTNLEEPFDRFVPQGLVYGRSYRVKSTGIYVASDDVEQITEPPKEGARSS
jgi:leucyl-tRNA synthetase